MNWNNWTKKQNIQKSFWRSKINTVDTLKSKSHSIWPIQVPRIFEKPKHQFRRSIGTCCTEIKNCKRHQIQYSIIQPKWPDVSPLYEKWRHSRTLPRMSKTEKCQTNWNTHYLRPNILSQWVWAAGNRLPLPHNLGDKESTTPGRSTRDKNTGPTIVHIVW